MCSFFNNFKDNKKSCLRKLSGSVNPSPLDQMAANLADDISKCIFVNEKFCILIKTSLKFVPKGPIDNKPVWFR